MSTFGFVQARMGSTRLPGKVLEPLAGLPSVQRVLERVACTPGLSAVALLTSDTSGDEPLRLLGSNLGIPVIAGSHDDVLDRFHLAAKQLGAGTILRVTADCPLTDPTVLGELLALFDNTPELDYAGIATGAIAARPGLRRYPDGLDGEVISADTLELAWREAKDPYEREHVTPFIWRKPERFKLALLEAPEDLGEERWTVDHAADLAFVQAVYERLADTRVPFDYREVLALLAREPGLRKLNATERITSTPVR
jgi:spore coat polysaccharide biosynthesis protein SpsF